MAGNRDLLSNTDWSATPLGPRAAWPESMRAVVDMAMSSGFPAAIVWGDEAIQIYNDGYNTIYGEKHPQAFGRPMRESWPEIWEFLKPAFDQVMATGEPVWFQDSLLPIARRGVPEEAWFDFSYSILRDDAGRGIGMISIAVEKTREAVLARRQACCELALPRSPEPPLVALGEALRERLAANPMDAAAASYRRLAGPGQAPQPALWSIGADDVADEDPRWQRLAITDGKGVPVARLDLLPSPLVSADSLAEFLATLSDRIQRVLHQAERLGQVEDALLQQDRLYRFLFDNIGEAAIYSATEGASNSEEMILATNAAADALFGYAPGELVGLRREDLFFPGSQELQQALVVREAQRNFTGELVFRRKDGQPLRLEVSSRLVQTQPGEYRAVSLLRDVSERARRDAERAAQSRFEAIAQLTGGMAHDFNNLLTVVLGSLEMLLDELPPDSRAATYAANALQCAERGAGLTSQLLSYSRRQPLKLQPVDLRAHLDELVPLLRSSLGEISELRVVPGDRLPACTSDLSQLTTALLALAANARDAMPGGGTLSLDADELELPADASGWRLPAGRYVRLALQDTGPGIAPELRERIFEPYFSTKGPGLGSGLGLAMVKGFLQQCGGDIRVADAPGGGARFELLFPVDARARGPVRPTPSAKVPVGDGACVLLVEDNALVRDQVRRLLLDAGYTVREASTAKEALERLSAAPRPDLVLTDLVMPGGMTGMQLAHAIREGHPDLPVIVMTGHDPWAAARSEADRQFDVLAKPFDRGTLLAALARAMG